MLFNWGHIVTVVLLVGAYLWVREVYERFHKDLEEVVNSDEPVARAVIIFYWLVTLVILIVVGGMVWHSVRVIIELIRHG